MGWKETARLQSIPVLCPHMRQGGKECAPPVDTKLGSEREGVCPGSWTDSGGNRDSHSGQGTSKVHLFDARASLLEVRRPAAPQSPDRLLEMP